MQCQRVMTWGNVERHASHIITTYVAPNYKISFFSCEWRNHVHQYILDSIPLSSIHNIHSIRLSSHSCQCEMGHLDISDKTSRYMHNLNILLKGKKSTILKGILRTKVLQRRPLHMASTCGNKRT